MAEINGLSILDSRAGGNTVTAPPVGGLSALDERAKGATLDQPQAPQQIQPSDRDIYTNPNLPRAQRYAAYLRADKDAAANGPYNLGAKVTDLTGSPALGTVVRMVPDVLSAITGAKIGQAAEPLMQSGARQLMQSALKPTISDLRTGKAAQAISTMLENGFNATKGGVEEMKSQIANLNDEISQRIANSTASIDKNAVAGRLKDLVDKFETQVSPNADVGAIEKAWNEFLQHPLLSGDSIPVQLAQKLKQGTYRALGNKAYGELKGADIEAQKGLARGLKEEISKAVPDVGPLNTKESQLINASNVAERRALLQDNNNLGGLVWLAHDPVAAIGFMADKSALVKSLLARALYSSAPYAPPLVGGAAGALLGSGNLGALYKQQ